MEYRSPAAASHEVDLYVRTYNSLLRSSGEVRVRAFEETHAFCRSVLHTGALSLIPDVSAFAYAAARLPEEMPQVKLVILGQSHELFEAEGYQVQSWHSVRTRGRRRPLAYDGQSILVVFIASASDIDDFVPIITAYQIEWNKMHGRLQGATQLLDEESSHSPSLLNMLSQRLGIDISEVERLIEAFQPSVFLKQMRNLIKSPLDIRLRMLAASYSQYQRAAQRWWSGVEPSFLQKASSRRAPVYFVSSNTHGTANLVGGYARAHKQELLQFAKERDPEGLGVSVNAASQKGDETELAPFLYYLLRHYLAAHREENLVQEIRAFEKEGGLIHLAEPGHIEIDAQLINLSAVVPSRLDHRLLIPNIELLSQSDAVVVNIDYPLGMAAYHLLSRLGQGVGELRGVYIMGKAATLNGRVGDVSLSDSVYDEHSHNTFFFKNALTTKEISPYLRYGSVFDNQAALTVRSAFLQNQEYTNHFYRQGYTVLEMEAGPFLSAIYELIHPTRVPGNKIIHLSSQTPFDIGIVHYASDTPYSRRQSLLSKSLSFFGVDATYACSIAIIKRIFQKEVERLSSKDKL
ncbi:DUF6909 family protein [Pajaroellobacter abortibovis]|uniref:Uncharacterized protein n=1 Tax=Pajaroellobacter abortibovis TaxID=1882918 RepID=A0A1L6MWP8_9BACT|nr:hypothetical protein [Pajaroellobacter abortibovis]APR99837.1 hypothetical protein BCY86_03460 [Pajaroellobacter abortibovis]